MKSIVYLKRSLLVSPGEPNRWRRHVLDMCLKVISRGIVHKTANGDVQIAELMRRAVGKPVNVKQDFPPWSLYAALAVYQIVGMEPSCKYENTHDIEWGYARYRDDDDNPQWAIYKAKNGEWLPMLLTDLHDLFKSRRQIWQPTEASPPGIGDLLVRHIDDEPGKAAIVLAYDSYTKRLLVYAGDNGKVSLANGMYGRGIGFETYHVRDEAWDWAISPSIVDYAKDVGYFSTERQARKACKERR